MDDVKPTTDLCKKCKTPKKKLLKYKQINNYLNLLEKLKKNPKLWYELHIN